MKFWQNIFPIIISSIAILLTIGHFLYQEFFRYHRAKVYFAVSVNEHYLIFANEGNSQELILDLAFGYESPDGVMNRYKGFPIKGQALPGILPKKEKMIIPVGQYIQVLHEKINHDYKDVRDKNNRKIHIEIRYFSRHNKNKVCRINIGDFKPYKDNFPTSFSPAKGNLW